MRAALSRRMSDPGVRPRAAALALYALVGLTACSTTRPAAPKTGAPQPAVAPQAQAAPGASEPSDASTDTAPPAPPAPSAAASIPPPCVCNPPAPKPRPKHTHKRKRPVKQAEPQSVGPALPPPANAVVDAEVGRIDSPLTAILGKNVYSTKGDDLGRVVDLLADPYGRVRVAIIDFGGFLGVGTRRIAVDWPLLHFSPTDKDKPLMLTVTREKLQSAPEYKDSNSPRVLMPPAEAPDAAGAGTTK